MKTASSCPEFLLTNEARHLASAFCNYASLGQAELARATLKQLHLKSPLKSLVLLDDIILNGPPSHWLCSVSVPSSAHLTWFCITLRHELLKMKRKTTNGTESKMIAKVIPLWLTDGTQFDILLITSLLESSTSNQKGFCHSVVQLLRKCLYSALASMAQPTPTYGGGNPNLIDNNVSETTTTLRSLNKKLPRKVPYSYRKSKASNLVPKIPIKVTKENFSGIGNYTETQTNKIFSSKKMHSSQVYTIDHNTKNSSSLRQTQLDYVFIKQLNVLPICNKFDSLGSTFEGSFTDHSFKILSDNTLIELRGVILLQPEIGEAIWRQLVQTLSKTNLPKTWGRSYFCLHSMLIQIVSVKLLCKDNDNASRFLQCLDVGSYFLNSPDTPDENIRMMSTVKKTMNELIEYLFTAIAKLMGGGTSQQQMQCQEDARLILVALASGKKEITTTDYDFSLLPWGETERQMSGYSHSVASHTKLPKLKQLNTFQIYEGLLSQDSNDLLIRLTKQQDKHSRELWCSSLLPEPFLTYSSPIHKRDGKWSVFWDSFVTFIIATKQHFISYVLSRTLHFVHRKEFSMASKLLEPFPELRGLAVLLSVEIFQGDIVSSNKLVDTLWSAFVVQRKQERARANTLQKAALEPEGKDFIDVNSPSCSEPRIERYCDQLHFQIDFAWWYAKRYINTSPINLTTKKHISDESESSGLCVASKCSFERKYNIEQNMNANRNGFGSSDVKTIANIALDAQKRGGIVWMIRECLPSLDENELIDVLDSRPQGSKMCMSQHDADMNVLRGYYAIKRVMSLFSPVSCKFDGLPHNHIDSSINESLDPVKKHLMMVPSLAWRVTLMEHIFNILFIQHKHVKAQYKSHIFSKSSSDVGLKNIPKDDHYLLTPALMKSLLILLREVNIKDIDSQVQKCVRLRAENLRQKVNEAWERFIVIETTDQHQEYNSTNFMTRMLASPESLMNICLKRSNYALCNRIISFFKLPASCVSTLTLSMTLDGVRDGEDIKSCTKEWLRDIVPILMDVTSGKGHESDGFSPQMYSFYLLVDLAICVAPSTEVSRCLLKTAQAILETWIIKSQGEGLKPYLGSCGHMKTSIVPDTLHRFFTFMTKYLLLLIDASKDSHNRSSLRTLLANIETLPTEPNLLESHLARKKSKMQALGALSQVFSLLKRGRQGKPSDTYLDTFMESVMKTFSADDIEPHTSSQEENPEYGVHKQCIKSSNGTMHYLLQFLQYIVEVRSLLRSCGVDSHNLSVLEHSPCSILARVIFENHGIVEARALSKLMGIDLLKLSLRSTIVNEFSRKASSHSVASPKIYRKNSEEYRHYRLNLEVVRFIADLERDYLFSQSALDDTRNSSSPINGLFLAPLCCVLRQSHNALDGRFIWYALEQSIAHTTLHRWICIKAQAIHYVFSYLLNDTNIDNQNIDGNNKNDQYTDAVSHFISYNFKHFKKWSTQVYGWEKYTKLTVVQQQCIDHVLVENDTQMCIIYKGIVQNLVNCGKLEAAIDLCDATLPPNTAFTEHLLLLSTKRYVESMQKRIDLPNDMVQNFSFQPGRNMDCNIQNFIRMQGIQKPIELALKAAKEWPVTVSIPVLNMCECRLKEYISNLQSGTAPKECNADKFHARDILARVSSQVKKLKLYQDILKVDQSHCWNRNWQNVAFSCSENPIEVSKRLAGWKQHELAQRVNEEFLPSYCLNDTESSSYATLSLELLEEWILDLLLYAENHELAFTKLTSLGSSAVALCQSLLKRIDSIKTKLLLVRFLLASVSSDETILSKESLKDQLRVHELSLKILIKLPSILQQHLIHLEAKPSLLIENLLMMEQIPLVALLFQEFQELRCDELVTKMAHKAMEWNVKSISNNLELQQCKFSYDYDFHFIKLIGNDVIDTETRKKHVYITSPNITLACSLLDLCTIPEIVSRACFAICDSISKRMCESATSSLIESMIEKLLQYAKYRLRKSSMVNDNILSDCTKLIRSIPILRTLYKLSTRDSCYSELAIPLTDLCRPECLCKIRDFLISPAIEHIELALQVCDTCDVPREPVYMQWGLELLRAGRDEEAQDKFDLCIPKLSKSETKLFVDNIVHILLQRRSHACATSVLRNQFRLLSMDLLHDSEVLKSNQEIVSHLPSFEDYTSLIPSTDTAQRAKRKCIHYLRKYRCSRSLLEFMLHHCHTFDGIVREILETDLPMFEFVEVVFDNILAHKRLKAFQETLSRLSPPIADSPQMKSFVQEAIALLRQRGLQRALYSIQMFAGLHEDAAIACGEMYAAGVDIPKKEALLTSIAWHLKQAIRDAEASKLATETKLNSSNSSLENDKLHDFDETLKRLRKDLLSVQLQQILNKKFPTIPSSFSLLSRPDESDTLLEHRRCCVVAHIMNMKGYDVSPIVEDSSMDDQGISQIVGLRTIVSTDRSQSEPCSTRRQKMSNCVNDDQHFESRMKVSMRMRGVIGRKSQRERHNVATAASLAEIIINDLKLPRDLCNIEATPKKESYVKPPGL